MKAPKRPETDPIDLEVELEKMENDPKRHINIIALYIRSKRLNLKNYGQIQQTIARHSKAARAAQVFDDKQILEALSKAKKVEGWTLETLLKFLTK